MLGHHAAGELGGGEDFYTIRSTVCGAGGRFGGSAALREPGCRVSCPGVQRILARLQLCYDSGCAELRERLRVQSRKRGGFGGFRGFRGTAPAALPEGSEDFSTILVVL